VAGVVLVAAACGDDDDVTSETSAAAAVTTEAPAETTTQATTAQDVVDAAQARVDAAEGGVDAAQDALAASTEQFCRDAESYVEVLDRYGKLFTDDAATVGDVQTLGADLVEPRDTVAAAAGDVEAAMTSLAAAEQELIDAQAALVAAVATASSVPSSSTEPATTTSTTIVEAATIARVQQAEDELTATAEGITAATPLAEASAEYNSAALALQIAWLTVLADAGCLTDEQHADAVEWVRGYTTAIQTQLQQAGYYDGEIDGIYGPLTVAGVKQLQADSGLRETGYVDQATARALEQRLVELGEQAAAADATQTAALQTVLTLTGFWRGPIDGQWTDELTDALIAFQTALGVAPTGAVDAATLAAFEQALGDLRAAATATTTVAETTPPVTLSPTPAPPAPTAPVTATPTATSGPGSAPG
jgi:peptidoglycan hydrolase-like protein with peptidoglycan-binding domain